MNKSFIVTRLENGLRIATSNMPHMKSVSTGVWFGCGSRYENIKINGVSHFIEHLVFKGTKKRTGDEICEMIEGVGGEINASTSEESTVFYVKIIREELPLAIEILLDMVVNPAFKKDFLEKQRDIIFEEIHMYEDTPPNHVEDLFNSLVWKDHPLGLNILGTIESMSGISRKDIIEYNRRMYCSNNCVIVAAGNIDHNEFVRLIKKHTRNLRQGRSVQFRPMRLKHSKPSLLIENKKTEQAHLLLGVPALHWTHPKRYALKIISTILAENMSSRLFKSVREERGYAYSIHTGIDRHIDAGTFYVAAGIVTEKIVPAIRLILRELTRLTRTKIPKKEFERAKEFVRGNLIMGSEQTMGRMHWLGESLRMADRINEIDYTINAVMNVSAEEVRNLAKSLFRNKHLNLALIGDIDKKAPIEKVLRFQ